MDPGPRPCSLSQEPNQLRVGRSAVPCSLAPALPAALDHSPAQAHLLVRCLIHTEQARLRAFGLCLARLQRRLHVPLPGPLAGKLMALFDA